MTGKCSAITARKIGIRQAFRKNTALVASNADLTGATITYAMQAAKIAGTRLTGATLMAVDMTGATGTPIYAGVDFTGTTCPDGTLANNHGTTCKGHPWP